VADLEVRIPTDEDLDVIVDLVRLCLGEGRIPRTREYWAWKHLANPFGPSYLLIAEERGAIVALRAFMRWTWWSSGQPVPAVRAVDTVTHPDWRGRGVFTSLTLAMVERVQSEGVAFVFNTPNDHSRPGYLKMGWTLVGRIHPWIRPQPLGRWYGRNAGGDFASVGQLLEAPGLDDLLSAMAADYDPRLITRPERAYLRWRYAESPGLAYHAAWQLDEGPGAALVFHVLERPRWTELRLCEILASPTRESMAQARDLIGKTARQAGAHFVSAVTAPRTPERRVLRSSGFVPFPRRGPFLTVRPLQASALEVDPRRRRSWRPTIGALEVF
jgi:GNAT superfamily N-acetyltransferase